MQPSVNPEHMDITGAQYAVVEPLFLPKCRDDQW